MTKTYLFFIVLISLTACKATKHDYPAEVTQNFMNACTENSGGNQEACACILEKIQKKYSIEEYSAMELKIQAGQAPSDFLEFIGKARVECAKK